LVIIWGKVTEGRKFWLTLKVMLTALKRMDDIKIMNDV
jgi:hypothetical protein